MQYFHYHLYICFTLLDHCFMSFLPVSLHLCTDLLFLLLLCLKYFAAFSLYGLYYLCLTWLSWCYINITRSSWPLSGCSVAIMCISIIYRPSSDILTCTVRLCCLCSDPLLSLSRALLGRAWCSATLQMRRRSACPSPSSWPTSSTQRWLSSDATASSAGCVPTLKHRWRFVFSRSTKQKSLCERVYCCYPGRPPGDLFWCQQTQADQRWLL